MAHLFCDVHIYLNCLIERLVVRVFYETAKRTFSVNIFFWLLFSRVNLIIFNLKNSAVIYIRVERPKWQYEITSDRRVRPGVCKGVCMRVFLSFTRKWKCLCDATRLFRMRNIRIERGQPLSGSHPPYPAAKNQFILLQFDLHVFLLWNSTRRRKIYTMARIIGRFCHTNWDPIPD